MSRYKQALEINKNAAGMPASAIAQAIHQCGAALLSEGFGTTQVSQDPAVKLMVWNLAKKLNVAELNQDISVMARLMDACETNAESSSDSGASVASRRWKDAEFAGSASNLTGLVGSIARHAKQMEDAGIAVDSDPALRLMAHQVEFLASVDSANDLHQQQDAHSCKTFLNASNALNVISQMQDRICARPAA